MPVIGRHALASVGAGLLMALGVVLVSPVAPAGASAPIVRLRPVPASTTRIVTWPVMTSVVPIWPTPSCGIRTCREPISPPLISSRPT